ncbi:MAG: hypothetical protein ACLSVD_14565 [Eggerthellaceae bacterium]
MGKLSHYINPKQIIEDKRIPAHDGPRRRAAEDCQFVFERSSTTC